MRSSQVSALTTQDLYSSVWTQKTSACFCFLRHLILGSSSVWWGNRLRKTKHFPGLGELQGLVCSEGDISYTAPVFSPPPLHQSLSELDKGSAVPGRACSWSPGCIPEDPMLDLPRLLPSSLQVSSITNSSRKRETSHSCAQFPAQLPSHFLWACAQECFSSLVYKETEAQGVTGLPWL